MAGFEIRDSIGWVYGSGFPKSLDVSKAIDKAAGAEREVIDTLVSPFKIDTGAADAEYSFMHGTTTMDDKGYRTTEITAPSTPEAKQWQGWGTALKPALEPIVVARKPLGEKTVAENVLTHGTGGLNIDGSRIGTQLGEKFSGGVAAQHSEGWDRPWMHDPDSIAKKQDRIKETIEKTQTLGRWPANLILDEYTADLLDEQSGTSKSATGTQTFHTALGRMNDDGWQPKTFTAEGYGDTGGASRFFYVAKASKRDRNEGLEDLEETTAADMVDREADSAGMNSPRAGAGRTSGAKNFHPTVKPTELMRYLVKLITPPGGTVLDPFTGSGSTGKAAILEGFDFIGIELTEDYWPIIEGRLKHAEAKVAERIKETSDQEQEKLF
jgi:site-specific DNA-methyltransferase (adenine-specific)